MKRVINERTELFLFNYESRLLMGAFRVTSDVMVHMPAAFGGRLPAQVYVEPAQSPVHQAVLNGDIRVGPRRRTRSTNLQSETSMRLSLNRYHSARAMCAQAGRLNRDTKVVPRKLLGPMPSHAWSSKT